MPEEQQDLGASRWIPEPSAWGTYRPPSYYCGIIAEGMSIALDEQYSIPTLNGVFVVLFVHQSSATTRTPQPRLPKQKGGGSLITREGHHEKSNDWMASDEDGGEMRTGLFAELRMQQRYTWRSSEAL